MLPDKVVKKEFRKKAWSNPDKYYATNFLKIEGFERKICSSCKKPFWSTNAEQKTCGDPVCFGGYKFINDTPAKNKLGYVETWQKFSKMFKDKGYLAIKRYPVVARWRKDVDFVQASIYDFQPYVVNGEVKPPAKKLVVPQFCLRFNDIDNVGVTGAHYTGFDMIGQHAFVTKDEWNQEQYFIDIYSWLRQGLKLPKQEIIFHEDAWAGGGNFGPCMEFFSRGLELGNQVYMMFEQSSKGYKELNLKVLDMGMGHERNAWFSTGNLTSYESTFPTVVKLLKDVIGLEIDKKILESFMPYASFLNLDEIEDVKSQWLNIAKMTGYDLATLKDYILKLAGMYSIAEHLRSLMFAINDGALPSNVGGGYNLRVIFRRLLSIAGKYNWNVPIEELCYEHARYLKPLYPELVEGMDEILKILHIEKTKYKAAQQKTKQIIGRIMVNKKTLTEDEMIRLYDSDGISPESLSMAAKAVGKEISVPEDFYTKVAEQHEARARVKIEKEVEIDVAGLPETKALYFDDYLKLECKAKVLRVQENYLVLDQTIFYPTSGGQAHDIGYINNEEVIDVFKAGNVIVHVLKEKVSFKQGDEVVCKIDKDRRLQLAQHHTATHIINAAAKLLLGKHVNQAGAKKDVDKAHLDITHYQALTEEELREIEAEANKIVQQNLPVKSYFLTRDMAESKFGMAIYQGGAVPGKMLRIVEIPNIDVEACGGTHVKSTKEVGLIKIIKSSKIQDGIVRLTFTAGKAAEIEENKEKGLILKTAEILKVEPEQVPARAEELFNKWKLARKAVKKHKPLDANDLKLVSTKKENLDYETLLTKTAKIFKTQPEHVPKTAKRFLDELDEMKTQILNPLQS